MGNYRSIQTRAPLCKLIILLLASNLFEPISTRAMWSNIPHPFELSRMSINRRHNNLLKTSTVAEADRTVTLLELTTLDALHQYTPATASVALSNMSRSPMAFTPSKNNRLIRYPSLNHSTVGVGRPRVTHIRKKLSSSLTDLLEGGTIMVGERAG